ncbi:unnamed protein product [Menidia menidia]|uniref:(Atlantic silverside) hypothetical protein n=1 Tax=Menidia menidia TaxID=238744 RepID=A0A8S4A9C9_9TELE|nr:unnamed protein product [Menidia menidia]
MGHMVSAVVPPSPGRKRLKETKKVWTGLRFLAGEWLWVGGAELLYGGLPACPPPGQHCGVLLKDSGGLEPRDCSERKNFLCYKR